jgi:putative copper resistance protein D
LHADPTNQPPPLTWVQFFTEWKWDWLFVVPASLGFGLYLWGVWRLRARGDRWPAVRTWSWCVGGIGTAVVAGVSVLGAYDTVLFSVHMVQHMMLTMITPVFLAIGAPITLLLRNLGAAGRRRVTRALHSWPMRVLLFPPLSTALLITTPFALYLTELYPFTLRVAWAHDLLHIYMVTVGCLFFFPMLGNDPMPNRLPYPMRMLLLFITMPAQAFLGTTIMGSSRLIAEEWYVSFNRAWPPSPIDDQYYAGAIMWATGDLTMGIIMTVFLAQWYADSRREAAREDRRLDREERLAAQRAAAGAAGGNHYDDGTGGRGAAPPEKEDE